eukprot:7491535-Heterocapsa_arctica.AAC.1
MPSPRGFSQVRVPSFRRAKSQKLVHGVPNCQTFATSGPGGAAASCRRRDRTSGRLMSCSSR